MIPRLVAEGVVCDAVVTDPPYHLLPTLKRFGAAGSAPAQHGRDARDRFGSRHPTVKPVDLMRWLVALGTPPGGLVLDPFAGSGTTGVAALAGGRRAILIEREPGYVSDIQERLAHFSGEGRHSLAVKSRARSDVRGPLL